MRTALSIVRALPAVVVLSLFAAVLPAQASGILVPTDESLPPLRITDHLVDVSIHDQVGLTTLTQTFRNDTERQLEATYIFPLPEEADLTNFQMTFNGKMVEGEVLPADEARQIYESIVRRQKDPGLIEFIGRRLLRMRVFPIEPKSDTTIKLSYQQVLRPISSMRGYHYPLRTRKTSGHAYGTVRFAVELDSQQPIKNIWSPTHSVEIVRDGDYEAKIAYEAAGGSLEEDFILLYSTDSSDLGLSAIAHKPEKDKAGHFLLLLSPKQLWPETEYQPQDVMFVLDTSGSMAGDKIAQARDALKYCINALDERDRFSVVRFSTGFDVLWEEVKDAGAAHKQEAAKFVDKFEAAGGTNISDTLDHVARMRPDDGGRPYVVVFLTDGQGNRDADEILKRIKNAAGDESSIRIFPFGVGHDVNTMLLDRLANGYHGRPVYVQPGENLELILGDFFATISQPVLTNLALTLPDIGVTDRFPVTLGDLYAGQQLTIAGKFDEAKTGTVRLTAMRNGKEVEYSWPKVAFENTQSADYVDSIWAGRKIAWMIDEIRQHGENDEMIDEIVALSKEYGIQTPYTSWLVAPEGRPGDDDAIVLRRQREMLRSAPSIDLVESTAGIPGGGGGGRIPNEPASEARDLDAYYAGDARLSLEEAEHAVTAESGAAANAIARGQAQLRRLESVDQGRLNEAALPSRTIAGRTYNRIGPFLVDAAVDEKRELIYVLFASEAYFDLVMARPDLKEVFAAARNVIIPAGEKHAVVIVDRKPDKNGEEGPEIEVLEKFSPETLELIGVAPRNG